MERVHRYRLVAARFLAACALLVAGGAGGCAGADLEQERTQQMGQKTIEQVQQEHTDAWMAIPGVVGTAVGQCGGKPCILVLTASNPEQVRRRIPPVVEGYAVVIQHSGQIRALDKP